MKIQGTKNKVVKLQIPRVCVTLKKIVSLAYALEETCNHLANCEFQFSLEEGWKGGREAKCKQQFNNKEKRLKEIFIVKNE
jgi:hypothetical protein